MVIHNFDIGSIAVLPNEANPIPVIDADAVLPYPVAFEGLKLEAGSSGH